MSERYVLAQPKPVARGRKARKPLPLVHAGGKRSRVPEPLQRYHAWEEAADKLWSKLVRSRTIMCQRCGQRPGCDPHHLISRRYHATRWLTQNGTHICKGCHLLVGQDSEENRDLALRLVGAERWEQLQITKRCSVKVDPQLALIALREEARRMGVPE